MKNFLLIACCLLLATSAEAHRFSTSFIQIESGEDHPQEFDWSWRIVEHDLAALAPFLVNDEGRLLPLDALEAQQPKFMKLISSALQFNAECAVEVLPVVYATREVYAGQESVRIYGHGSCPLATLNEVRVSDFFSVIKDHKVIVEIGEAEQRGVLSAAEPNWPMR
ncbi:hypothetical protein CWE22_08230 [Pseudidiomarina aestuarii]|uniref:Uncharacterized protein n=1 Tax=Pseudidiomarina aestuarii TaxID=624146 RepID=A0A7Z6ZW57_9GAMM|nr:hypothetical protein [Pseudidiomarina aestuarii]RUO42120.1 hypothetical protein CWE22_08230 [Pseudidiomarina aestuarii]